MCAPDYLLLKPGSLVLQASVEYLRLSKCCLDASFTGSLGKLHSLKYLYIHQERGLQGLPDLRGLTQLQELDLSGCSSLKCLPAGLGSLSSLCSLKLNSCSSMTQLRDSLGTLPSLKMIDLGGCTALSSLPSLSGLQSLQKLDLQECNSLTSVPLDGLSRLEELNLRGCSQLQSLPSSIGNLAKLRHLNLSSCSALQGLPILELCKLISLQSLERSKCPGLGPLPNSICHLRLADSEGLYLA